MARLDHRVALGLLLAGCASATLKPFTSPAEGGPPWTEVTTPHFVLATDHDQKTALAAAAQLEHMYALISELGFESKDLPAVKMERNAPLLDHAGKGDPDGGTQARPDQG